MIKITTVSLWYWPRGTEKVSKNLIKLEKIHPDYIWPFGVEMAKDYFCRRFSVDIADLGWKEMERRK